MHNCPICQKYFTHDGNLQAHIKAVHYGEKRQRRTNKFKCEICWKSLCSKRSYDEHKNTHFNCRPFKCSMCPYAAASQMTLRRHNLRQHVSKKDWHYRCPYCPCAFVEPTSYQSHIQHKHTGFSGTFGCDSCTYSTLSSKIFLQHVLKHSKGEIMPSFHQSSYPPINNYGQQPIKFDDRSKNLASSSQTPPPQFFVDQSFLTLENAHQVPAVGGQQIVSSSTSPPATFSSTFFQPASKNVAAASAVNNNVNRFLIDDDLGEGYQSGAARKKFISPASHGNDNFDEDDDDDDDEEDTSTSSMTSSDDDDDFDSDGSGTLYDLLDSGSVKFAQNGIPHTYFRQEITHSDIKLEPIISDPNQYLSAIPEACLQVEVSSQCDFGEKSIIGEQISIIRTIVAAKDLGNDVLPDGQVDFDLD